MKFQYLGHWSPHGLQATGGGIEASGIGTLVQLVHLADNLDVPSRNTRRDFGPLPASQQLATYKM